MVRIFGLLLLCTTSCLAQQFDVFCLSVGSADYIQDRSLLKEGSESFAEVNGARRSARYIFELFQNNAGAKGEMLRSEPGNYVTKEKLFSAMDRVLKMAQKSKSKNPLIVFYFCGHGVSEGIAWNQFLVPGDFKEKPANISNDPIALSIGDLGEKLIYVGDIIDKITEKKIPYVCLIDACYEGREEKFSSLTAVMSGTAIQNLKDVAAVLRFMNEYHSENAVVFATPPGTTTKVIDDPSIESGTYIGPLCRRMMLIAGKLKEMKEMSLADVMMFLNSNEFDPPTSAALTHWQFNEVSLKTLMKVKE